MQYFALGRHFALAGVVEMVYHMEMGRAAGYSTAVTDSRQANAEQSHAALRSFLLRHDCALAEEEIFVIMPTFVTIDRGAFEA